jgi:hypothetical protein
MVFSLVDYRPTGSFQWEDDYGDWTGKSPDGCLRTETYRLNFIALGSGPFRWTGLKISD